NPYMVGDLPSGIVARVAFSIRVDENASSGDYTVPVRLKFSKVTYSLVNGAPAISYEDDSDVEYVHVSVERKDYDFSISVKNSELVSGREGYVTVEITNTGSNSVENCVVMLNTTPPFKPNPSGLSAYLGHLSPTERKNATFKLFVMDGAMNQSYPVTFVIRFETSSGIPRLITKTVGLKVERVDHFRVVDVKSFLPAYLPVPSGIEIPGVRGYVSVRVENCGENVSDAVAYLKFENRLMRAENSPYIGQFSSGEVKELLFYVSSSAPSGRYRGTLEIRYRNELGDVEVSEPLTVEVVAGSQQPLLAEPVVRSIDVGSVDSLKLSIRNEMGVRVENLRLVLVSPERTITPLSSTAYIGSLRSGESREVAFRLSVSDQAAAGNRSLYLLERYSVDGVENLFSISEIPVEIRSGERAIQLVSIKSDLVPDETGSVELVIVNSGNRTMQDAVLELDLSPPLHPAGSSSLMGLSGKPQPSYYYLGTLKPGMKAVARFRVDVDKDAGMGEYPVSLRVRYSDEEGYTHLTSPITASLRVVERPLLTPLTIAILVAIVPALALSAVFLRRRMRGG
ncbi:MAG: hypothetical protein GXO67_07930, partial [Archaeoglobi archaeon]|nr:hypothetical protein [Archaeoglobi archaeon]